jgi:uncharacterized membrane protein YdjX (TVP38/TMEM64 family)
LDRRIIRLILVAALVIALVIAGRASGLFAALSTDKVRAIVQSAGAWGALIYLVLFSVGEFIHVPGMVFVAAAVLAWGRVGGGALAFVAAVVSVTVSFVVVRAVGGQPLATLRNPRARALLARLDERPLTTVIILRLMLWLLPGVNYALALSAIRFRPYLIGSAIGLLLPISVAAALFGIFFH